MSNTFIKLYNLWGSLSGLQTHWLSMNLVVIIVLVIVIIINILWGD